MLRHFCVSADGYALKARVEVIGVVCKTHWQAADYESGQLPARAAPLLFGIALDQLFLYVAPDQLYRLFLEIARLAGDPGLASLRLDPFRGLRGRTDIGPKPGKGVHVNGQVV